MAAELKAGACAHCNTHCTFEVVIAHQATGFYVGLCNTCALSGHPHIPQGAVYQVIERADLLGTQHRGRGGS